MNTEDYLSTIRNFNTHRTYKDALDLFFIHSVNNDFNLNGVKNFITFCKISRWSRDTIKLYLTILNGYNKFLKDNKNITIEQWYYVKEEIDKYSHSLPKKKKHKFELPSKDDIEKIFIYLSGGTHSGYNSDFINLRNKAIFLVLFSTGLRVSEVANLDMQSINFDNGEITTMIKGGKLHSVILSPAALLAVIAYIGTRSELKKSTPLFCRYDKKAGYNVNLFLGIRSIQNLFQQIKKENNIQYEFTPHTMRRLFASTEYKKSGNFFKIRQLLGHSASYDTTEIYIHDSVIN